MIEQYTYNKSSATLKLLKELEFAILSNSFEYDYMYPLRTIIRYYGVSDRTASNAIGILQELQVLEPVKGKGLRIHPDSKTFLIQRRTEIFKHELINLLKDTTLLNLTRNDIDQIIDHFFN